MTAECSFRLKRALSYFIAPDRRQAHVLPNYIGGFFDLIPKVQDLRPVSNDLVWYGDSETSPP